LSQLKPLTKMKYGQRTGKFRKIQTSESHYGISSLNTRTVFSQADCDI
jgi:hypothetical protein